MSVRMTTYFVLLLLSTPLWSRSLTRVPERIRELWGGLRRSLRRCARADNPRASPVAALELSELELAVVAELNREMASDYEQVASDPGQRLESRRRASELALALHERASLFQLEAQLRLGPSPPPAGAHVYSGPERRKDGRRVHSRRAGHEAASPRWGGERRTTPDRRRRDRRRDGTLAVL